MLSYTSVRLPPELSFARGFIRDLGDNNNISDPLLQAYIHRQWLLLIMTVATAATFFNAILAKCISSFVVVV